MHASRRLKVPAADGFVLGATLYSPPHGNGIVVLISPATAVVRGLYARFGRFLAAQGHTVLTWDWRGTGDSRPASLRRFGATLRTWAQCDLDGVIAWASREFPHSALTAVGHSFGGQAFGLAPGAARLKALVTIGAQHGYVGHWPGSRRIGLRLLWHGVMPAVAGTLGYWPGRALRTGEDLPKGVALEWARWCRSRHYHNQFAHYARLRAPMLVYSIDDDWIAPLSAVSALHRAYTGCQVTRRHLVPETLGMSRLGHFGLFQDGPARHVWQDISEWLSDNGASRGLRAGKPVARADPSPIAA